MYKIMFVCHGNICRSPMAEFVLKQMVKELGLSNQFIIASSATSREEIGNGVYPPVKRILNKQGIDCSNKKAVQLTKQDYDHYDYFIAMDDYNISNIMKIFKNDPKHKVRKLLNRNVADPWYTGNFDITYQDVNEGCYNLLKELNLLK